MINCLTENSRSTPEKIHLTLKENAHPIHCTDFPVPRTQVEVFKKECERLCKEDVLEPVGATEHAYPTFIIPKMDGTVRWVSDFWELNQNLRCHIYSLPQKQNVLHSWPGYKLFTKIDFSMCITPLNLMMQVRNFAWLLQPSGSSDSNACPWEYCKRRICAKKWWRVFS